jgi:hypothetical protein
MTRKEITVETGKSNTTVTGATFFGSSLGNKSAQRAIQRAGFNSGERTYTRKQIKWFCYRCNYPTVSIIFKILYLPVLLYKIFYHFKK